MNKPKLPAMSCIDVLKTYRGRKVLDEVLVLKMCSRISVRQLLFQHWVHWAPENKDKKGGWILDILGSAYLEIYKAEIRELQKPIQ